MLAPCLGKFGGIETFCLTLIEALIHKGASVRLLRKKVAGFVDDGSIQKNENEKIMKSINKFDKKNIDFAGAGKKRMSPSSSRRKTTHIDLCIFKSMRLNMAENRFLATSDRPW